MSASAAFFGMNQIADKIPALHAEKAESATNNVTKKMFPSLELVPFGN